MRRLIAILALLCGLAHAQTPQERANGAAVEDVATTAIGLALGAAEANPLGLLTLPAKLAMLAHADTLPTGERESTFSLIGSVWRGAAANNVCVIVAILSGGAFGPACAMVGLAVAVNRWESEADERLFWAHCAHERKENPALKCEWRAG